MRFPGGKFLAVTLTVLLNAVPAVVMYYGAKAAAAVGNRLSRLRLGLRGLTGGGVGESIPSSLSGGRKTVKAKDKNRKEAKENNSKEAKDKKSLSPEERVESRYRDRIDTWVLSGRVKEDPGDWKALVRQLSADIDAQDAKIKDWSSRVYKDANISVNNHQKKKESVKSVNERRRQERIKGFERQKSGDMKILRDLAKAGGLTVAELRSLAEEAQKAEMSENEKTENGESVSPEAAATAEETKEYEKENDNISVNGSEEEDEQQEQQEYSDPDDDILGEEYRPDDYQKDGLDGDEPLVPDEETTENEEPSENDVLADSETEDVTPETPEETVTGEEDAPKGSQDEDEEEEESLDETPAGDVAEYNYIWGVAGKGFCVERNVNDFGKDGSAIKSDAKGNFIPNNFSLFRSTNDIESFFDIQTGGNLLKDATGFEILRKGKMTMVGEDNHKKIGRVEERCVIRLLGPRQKEDDTLKMPVKDEKKNDADDSLSEKPVTFSESLENALKEWYHIKEQYDNDGVQGSYNVDELEKARKERQTFIANTEHSISLLADGDDKRQLENSLSSLKIMDGILTESEDIAEWANMQHYTKDSKYFIYNGVVSPSGVVDRTMSRAIYKVANGLMNDTEFKAVCDKEGKGEWYENFKNDPDATIRKWENNGILVGNIYYGETDNETTGLHEETSSSKRLYRRGDYYPEMTMISVETSDDLRTLRAKGITEEFDSPARLLDAFRDKYPQKIIRFSDENGNPLEDTDNHLKKHTDLGGTGITTWQAEKPLYLLIEPWEKYFKNRQTDLFDNNYPDSEVMRAAREDTRRFASLLNISDKVNIITDAGSLSEGEKSVKGWYDRDTDRISVVLPNHSDPDDIRRTVFHEGVAHYGLRRLFGERFDTFLDNVHDNAAADVRKRIDNISKTEGLSRRDATEEYLARLSEDTDFGRAMQTGWWGKIRELFLQMLGRAGVNLDYKLTDSELRYILWRSYENLRSPEERRTVSSLIKKDREDAVDKLRGLYGKIDDTKENYAEYLDDPSVKGWISGWQKEIDELQKAYGLSRADVFPEEKSAGTDIAAEETPTVAREQALRDTVSGIIKDAGIDVVYDKEACQEALRAMRRTGDTSYQRVYHGSGSDFDRFDRDLIIQDKLRFFHTPDGEAYGFTTGGKIYLDPDIATAETPIHEYTHLWAEALRRRNPEEWNNVVGLMKQCDTVWNDVRRNYPELTDDNDIADEVLATYSGRRGAERLRTLRDGILSGDSSEDEKKVATSAIDSFRDLLSRIWKDIADFLHIHYTKPEEVADRVLSDLVNGVNPSKALDDAYSRAVSEGRTDDALRILEDVAKAKGYDVTDYQGRDSWTAPVAEVEKDDFANLDKLRESLDDYGGESNIYGIINGIQGHDSSYYYDPSKAGFHGKAAEETAEIMRSLHERNASPDTKVSIYRAVPNDVFGDEIMQGDWVALSRTYCDDLGREKYGEGGYHIIQSEAPIKYLWQGDEDMREFGYDDGQRDVEKNVSNNRKLLEITYDDNGKLIPLSKRFDIAASDIRYQFIGENDEENSNTADSLGKKVEELFNGAVNGTFSGKPVSVGRLSPEGKAFLERLSGLKMKEHVDFVLNPSDLKHIYNDHFGNNEKDRGNNVPLTRNDFGNFYGVLSNPDGIVYGVDKNDGRKLFFFLKQKFPGLYNLAEVCSTKKGNLTAKSYYITKKGINQRVMEIKSTLLPTSVTYSGESLSDTKIPLLFENTVKKDENLSKDAINFNNTSARPDERANNNSVMANNEKEKARQVQSSPESVGDLKDKETVNDGIKYADTAGAASIDKFIEENGHIVGKEPDRNFDILQVDFRDGSTLRRTPQFVTDGAHLRLNYELTGPKVEGKAVESVNFSLFPDDLDRRGLIDDGRFNSAVSEILKKTETPTLSNKEALRDVDSFVDKYGFDVLGGSGRRAYLDDKRFVERRDTTVVGLQNKGEVTGGKYYFISDDEGRLPQDAAVYVPAMKDTADHILFNDPDSYGSGIQTVRDAVVTAGVSNSSIVRDIDKFLENHGFEAGDDLGSLRIVDFLDGSQMRRHEQPHSKRAEYMILNSSHEIISFANVPDKRHILDLTPGRAEALSSIRNTLLSRPMRPSNDVALEVIGDFIRDNGRVIEGSDGLKAVDFRDGSSLVGFQKDGERHFEYRDRNAIPYGVVVSRDMTPKDINLSPSMDKAVNLMYNALDKPLNNDVTLSKEAQDMRSYTNTQGRWHGEEQNELRVYSEYGNILAYFSDHTSKAKPLGVEDYVIGRNPTESLMLSVWKRINHFNSRTFIPVEKLRELGIPVNPMAKPLPLIRDGREGRHIVNMYNIESTDFLQRSKDYDKETRSYINNLMRSAEHSVLTGDGKYKMWSQLEDLVIKSGNWHLPVESTPKDYDRLKDMGLSARYDWTNKKVSVAPLEMEQPSYGGKRYMDILDSLSESVLDRDNKLIVKNGVGDENTLNVAHLMNAIDFGIDLRDVADRPDVPGEYVTPLITDADALRSEGPEYVRTVLTEASKADDSIMKRSIGMDDDLSVNSDITIDDDDDDRLDLRTTTPGMGDDDGDGISDDQENYAPSTKEDNRLKRKSDESSHRSFHR